MKKIKRFKFCFIGYIFSFLSLNTYSQDTITIDTFNRQNLPAAKRPPYSYYSSNRNGDTIFYSKYLKIDLIYRLSYTPMEIGNLWITYYKNGVIKEIGAFKRFKPSLFTNKRNLTKVKYGLWLYFSEEGKLIKKVYEYSKSAGYYVK